MTRYQCPRIIAVQAPPRSAVELRNADGVLNTNNYLIWRCVSDTPGIKVCNDESVRRHYVQAFAERVAAFFPAPERRANSEWRKGNRQRGGGRDFANAVALFQVAIALGAVAALTGTRVVWWGSVGTGVGGIVLFLQQFLR